MRGWRRFLLNLFGANISSTAGVYSSAKIWSPANLTMHDHSYIGPDVKVYCMAKITFDRYALASQGAHLCAGTHDIYDADFPLYAKPILLGPRAWVAAEAFVGPGVTVGEGAVLGARGCAFRDLDAWTVYAGNPAREIKKRKFRRSADTMEDENP
jgi:putative colanic acid biosynthesis acetyltransferase WcaF